MPWVAPAVVDGLKRRAPAHPQAGGDVLGHRYIAPATSIELGLRYYAGFDNVSNDIGLDDENLSVYKNRSILFIVGLRWTPGKDPDRDGVPDGSDVCPRQADDHDAWVDPERRGCPEDYPEPGASFVS